MNTIDVQPENVVATERGRKLSDYPYGGFHVGDKVWYCRRFYENGWGLDDPYRDRVAVVVPDQDNCLLKVHWIGDPDDVFDYHRANNFELAAVAEGK